MNSSTFNILELYSGIGGFHFAIQKYFESILFDNYKITAVDINTSANEVYKLSHLKSNEKHVLLERNIQSFTVEELDRMKLNLVTMSPPCQPFSRLGLKKGLVDNRCDSFRHLMNIFPQLTNKPNYIMVENVKGFDGSDAHKLLLTTLDHVGYRYEQFLLSPFQFSIPNSRTRYYLVAFYVGEIVSKTIPNETIHLQVPLLKKYETIFNYTNIDFKDQINIDNKITIGDYIETSLDLQLKEFEISDTILLRYHMIFDIVELNSTCSNCFTKSYGHRVEGCGSILKTSTETTVDVIYSKFNSIKLNCDQKSEEIIVELLRSLKLRYFTPKEIASLMCFPNGLEFPKSFNRQQKYRLLGNSVNVFVCYYLLSILLDEDLIRNQL